MALDVEQHPQYMAEKKYLDYALKCLEEKIDRLEGPPDSWTYRADSRAMKNSNHQEIGDLEFVHEQIYFGKWEQQDGLILYIGKYMLDSPSDLSRPVVVSWMTKAAEKWYLASPADSLGLTLKRLLEVSGDRLLKISDVPIARPELDETLDHILDQLARDRTSKMADIVSSIQGDQYRLVSRDPDGVQVIQGGPGTGKTAVALHRAAWLIFNYRQAMKEGILFLGPSSSFMEYVEPVLPSLGEKSVQHRSIHRLDSILPDATKTDRLAIRQLKGDLRMAEVVKKAVYSEIQLPAEPLTVTLGKWTGTLTLSQLTDLQRNVMAKALPSNQARVQFRERVEEALYRASPSTLWDLDRFRKELRRDGSIADSQGVENQILPGSGKARRLWKKFPSETWPVIRYEKVVRMLLSRPEQLRAASDGSLQEAERQLLLEGSPKEWTTDDLPLLDEAKFLTDGIGETFSHIIIDEAQDLSPMQIRAVCRRVPTKSMTVVGDLAQCTGPWTYRTWEELFSNSGLTLNPTAELMINYRVPKEIMERVSLLLPLMGGDFQPPKAIRPGAPPSVLWTTASGILELVSKTALDLIRQTSGSLAIIADEAYLPELEAGLRQKISGPGAHVEASPNLRCSILAPEQAKGREFDYVIVVEPSAILESKHGPAKLYVGMTRATKQLCLIYTKSCAVTEALA